MADTLHTYRATVEFQTTQEGLAHMGDVLGRCFSELSAAHGECDPQIVAMVEVGTEN